MVLCLYSQSENNWFLKKYMYSLPDVLHVEGVLKAHVFHIIVVGDFVRVLSLQMSENKSSFEVLIFFLGCIEIKKDT